jgi:hypothetical protein
MRHDAFLIISARSQRARTDEATCQTLAVPWAVLCCVTQTSEWLPKPRASVADAARQCRPLGVPSCGTGHIESGGLFEKTKLVVIFLASRGRRWPIKQPGRARTSRGTGAPVGEHPCAASHLFCWGICRRAQRPNKSGCVATKVCKSPRRLTERERGSNDRAAGTLRRATETPVKGRLRTVITVIGFAPRVRSPRPQVAAPVACGHDGARGAGGQQLLTTPTGQLLTGFGRDGAVRPALPPNSRCARLTESGHGVCARGQGCAREAKKSRRRVRNSRASAFTFALHTSASRRVSHAPHSHARSKNRQED